MTESDPTRIRRFAEHLVARDVAVAVGIGRPTATTTHIARSHRDAAAALGTVLAPLSSLRPAGIQRRIAAFDDVREQLGLMRVAAVLDDLDVVDNDTAARILAHDAANGSELAATVLVYLDTQHSVRATGEALHVHQNPSAIGSPPCVTSSGSTSTTRPDGCGCGCGCPPRSTGSLGSGGQQPGPGEARWTAGPVRQVISLRPSREQAEQPSFAHGSSVSDEANRSPPGASRRVDR